VWAPSSRVSLQSATEARVRRETVEESGEGGGGLYLPLFGYHQYQDLNDYELEDDLYGDEDDSFENNTST